MIPEFAILHIHHFSRLIALTYILEADVLRINLLSCHALMWICLCVTVINETRLAFLSNG